MAYRTENLEKESSHINIYGMLLGAVGAGKSSLVNSLTKLYGDYYPKRKYPYIPTARKQLKDGHTMMREPVQLTDTLTIVDNRGWNDWGNKAALRELTAQIHGKRSYDEDVTWTDTGVTSDARVVSKKIDCIAIVIDGNRGIGAIENLGKLIETCRKNIRRRPSFVITHREKMSAEEIKNITSTLENDYDVYREKIIVIKNVTTRNDTLDAESKSYLTSFMEEWVSDGEAGAASHARRGEQSEVEDKLEMMEKERNNTLGKLDLETERQTEAKIQLDIETKRLKMIADISVRIQKSEYENTEDCYALKKDQIQMLNQLKLEQNRALHEHDKKCLEKYYVKKY